MGIIEVLIVFILTITIANHNDKPNTLQFYTKKYEKELGVKVNYPVTFDDIASQPDWEGVAGRCWWPEDGRRVEIDKAWWFDDNTTELQREELLYHELSHCSLFLDHSGEMKTMNNEMCPASIMFASVFTEKDSERCYSNNRDYYIKELKTNKSDIRKRETFH